MKPQYKMQTYSKRRSHYLMVRRRMPVINWEGQSTIQGCSFQRSVRTIVNARLTVSERITGEIARLRLRDHWCSVAEAGIRRWRQRMGRERETTAEQSVTVRQTMLDDGSLTRPGFDSGRTGPPCWPDIHRSVLSPPVRGGLTSASFYLCGVLDRSL